jgi:hypothetical protein
MERLGQGKCVVVVISKRYLESENCMFELIQIAKNGDFHDRIFPIVLDDTKLYDPIDRIKYVEYWEGKASALDEAMKRVSLANMEGFWQDRNLYEEIRRNVPLLTNIIRDMNTLTANIHTESNYEEVYRAVEEKLGE